MLLTDTTQWAPSLLSAYKDSLTEAGYRVLVSGYPGERAGELKARLPWLLQPGVEVFLYDERLAGAAGLDSLTAYLKSVGHPGILRSVRHPGPQKRN